MSEKALPNPGTYPAKTSAQMVVYETEEGALCVAIPTELIGSEVAWRGKHTATIAKRDGTLMTRRIDELKTIFGWDGLNPFDLQNIEPGQHEFEIVGEHSTYTQAGDNQEERTTFKIVFMNPPGGSSQMPGVLDAQGQKSLLAKYASKFKAHSGGGSAAAKKPAAAASVPQAPAKAKVGGPPSRPKGSASSVAARTSTQQEVWDGLVAKSPDASEDDLGTIFWEAVNEIAPGKNGELTPTEWGTVADKLEV